MVVGVPAGAKNVLFEIAGSAGGRGGGNFNNPGGPNRVGGRGGAMWNPEFNQDFDFDAYDDIYSEDFYDDYMAPYLEAEEDKAYQDMMNKANWVQ